MWFFKTGSGSTRGSTSGTQSLRSEPSQERIDELESINARLRGHLLRERTLPSVPAALEVSDPRWDQAGFDAWASMNEDGIHAVCFVRVGYLRRLAHSGGNV